MLGYFPEIYPGELIYSWVCRYYSHNGYPGYRQALDDLLVSSNDKIHYEFAGHFNAEAMRVFESMYSYKELILHHTMYPYYARFDTLERRQNALAGLITGDRKIDSLMQFQNDKQHHHLQYCPLCTIEDRDEYGETYFHRTHQIRGLSTCPKHHCQLAETSVRVYGNASPRLHVAEELIPYKTEIRSASDAEVKFSSYLVKLFIEPINFANAVPIGEFLATRLEGTKYMPSSKSCIYCQTLAKNMNQFYGKEIIKGHQIQKVISGERIDFARIAMIAYFLNITIGELCNPIINHQRSTYQPKPRKPTNHDVRKGMRKENWNDIDTVSLPHIKKVIEGIKHGQDRPGRITLRAICKTMSWPDKRLDNLPLCKAEVKANIEPIEEFWAKEVIWAYNKVKEAAGQRRIFWRDIRSLINIRRDQFNSTHHLLEKFSSKEVADKIKSL